MNLMEKEYYKNIEGYKTQLINNLGGYISDEFAELETIIQTTLEGELRDKISESSQNVFTNIRQFLLRVHSGEVGLDPCDEHLVKSNEGE